MGRPDTGDTTDYQKQDIHEDLCSPPSYDQQQQPPQPQQLAPPQQQPQYNQPNPPPPHAPVQFPPTSPQLNTQGFPYQPTAYPAQNPPPAAYPPSEQELQQTYSTPGVTQQYPPPELLDGWTTGLFDCMDDPTNAMITLFFPCLTFGQVAEIVDNGQTPCGTSGLLYFLIFSFSVMPCIYSCTYRAKLRSKFGLMETPAPDWIVHFLCEPCALCQAYRELHKRGWDPSIGWMGNVQRNLYQQAQQAMVPPSNQRMMMG